MEDTSGRIKISVGNAFLEIEGTEDYIERKLKDIPSFDSLIKRLSEAAPSVPTVGEAVKPRREVKQVKKKKSISKVRMNYTVLPDLDLTAKNDIPSLTNFYSEKKPANAMESNVLFVYYLKNLKNIEKVGLNHIYTCYKATKKKTPKALYQSLADTRKAKGWIITTDMDDIRIGIAGENFVEHDLPRPTKSKK